MPPMRWSSAAEHDCAEGTSSDLMMRPTSEWQVVYASAEWKNKTSPTVMSAKATRTKAGFTNTPAHHVPTFEAVHSVQ